MVAVAKCRPMYQLSTISTINNDKVRTSLSSLSATAVRDSSVLPSLLLSYEKRSRKNILQTAKRTTSTLTMAHILSAVQGTIQDIVPIKRVLVSVSDKTGIVELCQYLVSKWKVELISTGGTASALRTAGLTVMDVSEYTGTTECLDGRVKTLHPKIHGGLLAVRGNAQHSQEMQQQGMQYIDMTILNLYPFEETMKQNNVTFAQCIENIDIGGPSMLRSTAKNHMSTTIVTSPLQYEELRHVLETHGGSTTLSVRKRYAATAFAVSAAYDSMIATYMASQLMTLDHTDTTLTGSTTTTTTTTTPPLLLEGRQPVVTRVYQPEFSLKYGCNPQQVPAQILSRWGHSLPFQVLNGTPGYINLLDAVNAYQLVHELHTSTGLVAATSFKHVSPAGAALAIPLSDVECLAYEVSNEQRQSMTPVSLAYLRARNADPMCSFGDFCAVSDIVDEATALFLKREVSDGIIAPGYTDAALNILKGKKNGSFIMLQATSNYDPGEYEFREVYGMTFQQKRNTTIIGKDHMVSNVVTKKNTTLSDDAIRDLILASICIKYTQSNSVGFSRNGMMIGVGAGQQSRVDCVKLAGRKVMTWYLRQHPKVIALPFKDTVKRQDRVNARVRYIEGDFTNEERVRWETQFTTVPEPLTEVEKDEFMKTSTGISISSDAFFPFRDSIDHASKIGVSYVVQPGGSVQDDAVTEACDEYNMTMAFTGIRLFHH